MGEEEDEINRLAHQVLDRGYSAVAAQNELKLKKDGTFNRIYKKEKLISARIETIQAERANLLNQRHIVG